MGLDIDLRDPAFHADPYPTYAALRDEAPVCWSEQMGYWLITRYADVSGLLHAADACTSDSFWDRPVSHHNPGDHDESYVVQSFSTAMIFHDPPRHTRLRRSVNRAFTPARVAARHDQIRELAHILLDDARQHTTFDFIADFAAPLPILVIADLLGIPVQDRTQVREASDQFAVLFEPMLSTDERTRALHHSADLGRYLDDIVAQRRDDPQDDLISGLVTIQEQEGGLSEEELRAMLLHLLVAGNETTTGLLAHMFLVLDRDQSLRARIGSTPELVPDAVEEALRYEAPIQFLTRQTTRPLELHGETIPARSLISLVLGSANRDPHRFENPDRFIPHRSDNQHVSFGWGPHFCIGAPLARLEGQMAMRLLVGEFADIHQSDEPAIRKPDQLLRGYQKLPATSHPARASVMLG
jgi:cytochrome P450